MDHQIAEESGAVDRYLLDEMSIEERRVFEGHFFDCATCAEKVRQGVAFIENAKQVLREREFAPESNPKRVRRPLFRWLRAPVLIPAFASLCLAMIVGYQNLVTLPGLRAPRVLSTIAIAPLSREALPRVFIDPGKPLFNLNFTVDSPRVYPNYRCEFRDARGTPVLALDSGEEDFSSFTLSFLLPASRFPDGVYELVLRPMDNPATIVQQYTFIIQRGRPNEHTSN